MTREHAVQRLTTVLGTVRAHEFRAADGTRFRITFSAGVAESPTDGADIPALYRAADQALYEAKEGGRDQVLPAGWSAARPRAAQSTDVVVVESDEAQARALLQALETRGYRTHWLTDGQTAVETLAGQPPALKARVIVLDVSLPRRDGFSVLRALVQDTSLRDTHIVMLTGCASEAEELRAFELGAFDYVAKLVSPPVVVQRIQRVLRS